MNDETLIALKGSIAKWQGIVDGTTKDEGPSNCPLCRLFYYDFREDGGRGGRGCDGCPVFARTGYRCCSATPSSDYCIARHGKQDDKMALAAKAELEFLKSLLPPVSESAR